MADEAQIVALRRELSAGPQVLALIVDRPVSTFGKVLRRAGCSRLPRPERAISPCYERERPGELLHVDVKKLGRFWQVGKRIHQDGINRSRKAGWSYLHIAIDDTPGSRRPSCSRTSAAHPVRHSSHGRTAGSPTS